VLGAFVPRHGPAGGIAFIVPGLIVILALSVLFLTGNPPHWVRGPGAGAVAPVAPVAVQAGWSLTGPSWNGWGAGITNTRFQSGDAAGMTARDVPRLKLAWAFGLPGASSGGTQPVVAGGRIYVGGAEGDFFALDAKSGCVDWHIEVEAGIRSAITLGERSGGGLTAKNR